MEKFAQIFSKLCEFMGLIGYLMRQFVGGERNFWPVQNPSKCSKIWPTCDFKRQAKCLKSDGRYCKSCILLSRVNSILKRTLKVQKIFARWIPHKLTDDQRRVRVQTINQLLKMFPKLNYICIYCNLILGTKHVSLLKTSKKSWKQTMADCSSSSW